MEDYSSWQKLSSTTPLIRACKLGRITKVVHLLDKCREDIEQVGLYEDSSGRCEEATPLISAILGGNITVVHVLLSRKASVNYRSPSGRTPLHFACDGEQLEILQLLAEHGADLDAIDVYKETCLMLSCREGKIPIIKYLVEKGCNVNVRNSSGHTALHYACSGGKLEVIEFLLENGAISKTDTADITLLLYAATHGHSKLVDFFIEVLHCSESEQMDAYDILGCTYIKGRNGIEMAYKEWMRSMRIRENTMPLIEKSKELSPISKILKVKEVRSLNELEALYGERTELELQSLLFTERILGASHRQCSFTIANLCSNMKDSESCLNLLIYVIKMQQIKLNALNDDTRYIFHTLLKCLFNLTTEERVSHFQKIVDSYELAFNQVIAAQKIEGFDLEEISYSDLLYIIMRLIELLSFTLNSISSNERPSLSNIIKPFLQMNVSGGNKHQTVLHMVFFMKLSICTLQEMITVLLEAGADPNVGDIDGYTPLHVAALQNCNDVIYKLLLQKGAHVDYRNKMGKTAQQLVKSRTNIFNSIQYYSLQCLCGHVVKNKNLKYKGNVPKQIEMFLDLH